MLRRLDCTALGSGWLCRLSLLLGRKPPQATRPKATQSKISADENLRRTVTVKIGGPVRNNVAPTHIRSWLPKHEFCW
jgi:hypothetical protein